jgi:hypothetical protein
LILNLVPYQADPGESAVASLSTSWFNGPDFTFNLAAWDANKLLQQRLGKQLMLPNRLAAGFSVVML